MSLLTIGRVGNINNSIVTPRLQLSSSGKIITEEEFGLTPTRLRF